MFCQKCGAAIPEQATACGNCGAALAAPNPAAAAAAVAAEKVRAASKDALSAFKMFASDPVPGLAVACVSLGPSRALGVGVVFGVVFALCIILAIYRLLPEWGRPNGFTGFIEIFVFAVVPFLSLLGATFCVRRTFRGEGGVGQDAFIAGASLLPSAFVVLLAGILGVGNIEVIAVFSLFALCLTILMLFAGLTRIYRTSERFATIAVPLMLIVSTWFSKIIYTAMLK